MTPAQHPSSLIGKCWTREQGEPELNEYDLPVPTLVPWLGKTVPNPEGYGIYFQQRWDEALQANPQFLYINDWNEWTAGKYSPGAGKTFPFMRRQSNYFFVDQYNSEFNRCIHPMKGGYTDNYYMQMAQNIRRYKGIRPIPELSGLNHMQIDGEFADWQPVEVEYRDTVGDTFHRDYKGYGDFHYQNDSGRNDIDHVQSGVDEDQVYFYAETNDELTPHTDNNWMLLLIDADQNHDTGWFGYDYLVNRRVIDAKHHDADALRRRMPRIRGSNRRNCPFATQANRWNWLCRESSSAGQVTPSVSISIGVTIPPNLQTRFRCASMATVRRIGGSITAVSGRVKGELAWLLYCLFSIQQASDLL